MALNFPNVPTLGEEFTSGGVTWVWDGTKWTVANLSTGLYLPLTGGTLTGPLAGTAATFSGPAYQLTLDSPNVAAGVGILGSIAGAPRWEIDLGNGSPEGGGDSGSDFGVYRYNDAGALVDAPLTLDRATGVASFRGGILLEGGAGPAAFEIQSAGAPVVQFVWQTLENAVGVFFAPPFSTALWLNTSLEFEFAGGTGVAVKAGGTAWVNTSDARIKTVLGEYAPGLDEVLQLRPVSYVYNGNDTPSADVNTPMGASPDATTTMDVKVAPYPASRHYRVATDQKVFTGLIAQEVETIFPGMVTQKAGFIDGQPVSDLRQLDTNELIYALVNALKTLTARVEVLEAQVATHH